MIRNKILRRVRIKSFLFRNGLYAFIFTMIFAFAFLLRKPIEACFLFLVYVFIRYKFPKTFHHPNAYWCVFWSIISFWLCIVAVLPIKYSILSSVVVSTIFCYILYKVQDYVDLKNEVEELKKPKIVKIDLDTISEEDLRILCKNKHLNEENSQLAVEFFIKKTKHSILADKYCVEEKSITTRKKRLKKKLLE